jgi:Galactose oxidase-like, Early set domain
VLPPLVPQDKYRARIMQAGGSTPFILDTTNPAAGWTAATRSMFDNPTTGDVNPVRENADSVILPTGEILIEGGLKVGSSDATGVTSPELFDPTTSARQVLPHSPVVRGYHSTALLMPNGAVWVASSNFNANPGLSNRELRIEIFEPWYFCGRRPTITDAPPRARHGDEVQILTPDAATVTRVVLVRAGTVTHNFNPDQRHVTLEFRRGEADSIIAERPQPRHRRLSPAVRHRRHRPAEHRPFPADHPTNRRVESGVARRVVGAVLADNRRPGPDNLRWITRDLAPTAPPPLRRPLATEPHGGGDQGGHVHGPTPPDHDHDHDHDHPDNDDDDGPHDDQGPGGGHHH